jgi:hypothetical protein
LLLRRFARVELLGRLGNRGLLEQPPEYREALFREVRAVVAEHIPTTVDPLLRPAQRVQMALVRADRLDLVVGLVVAQQQVKGVARLVRIEATGRGTLHLVVRAHLDAGHGPLEVRALGDRLALEVPDEVAAIVPPAAFEVPTPLSGSARMVIRRREDSAELVVPASIAQQVDVAEDGGLRPRWILDGEIDPMTIASGAPVWSGAWEIAVRVSFAGYVKEPLVQPADDEPFDGGKVALPESGSLSVFAYWSESGRRLTLSVRTVAERRESMRPTRRLGRLLRRLRDRVRPRQHERGARSPR